MDTPKRSGSAAPNSSDAKRIKLTLPHKNQGATWTQHDNIRWSSPNLDSDMEEFRCCLHLKFWGGSYINLYMKNWGRICVQFMFWRLLLWIRDNKRCHFQSFHILKGVRNKMDWKRWELEPAATTYMYLTRMLVCNTQSTRLATEQPQSCIW